MAEERTDSSRGAIEDVIATDFIRRGETITRIVNVSHQGDTQSGQRLARQLNWQIVLLQGGTVLAGDLNAHSTRWDPRCQVQLIATFWEDVIDDNGLEIGNDGEATHHWTREGHEGESVINLTLVD